MSLFDNNAKQTILTIGVDEMSSYYLLQTVRWTKFLAIIGFVIIGIMTLAIIPMVFMSASVALASLSKIPGAAMPVGFAIFLLVVFLFLYIYPTLSLMRFSSHMKRAILGADQLAFSTALRHQRNLYRYLGILMIVIISIYVLIFLLGLLSLF